MASNLNYDCTLEKGKVSRGVDSLTLENVAIKSLTLDDKSSKGDKQLSKISRTPPRPISGAQRLQRESGTDSATKGLVYRSKSLPAEDLPKERPENDEEETDDSEWSLPCEYVRPNLHPYRRFSLPITPVCARGTEVFPSTPRRNSLATSTLRTISRHYELFGAHKRILEEQGEDSDLTSPQGIGQFQLPSLLVRRVEETTTPYGSL